MLYGLNENDIRKIKKDLEKLPPCFFEAKNEILSGYGYWYPLSGKEPSMRAAVFSLDKIYEDRMIDLIKTVFEVAGIEEATGYHPYWYEGQKTWNYVQDMAKLLYKQDGDDYVFPQLMEMYYYDKSEEWIIYVSHEGTITFAGEDLMQISKNIIPDLYTVTASLRPYNT